MRLIFLTRAMMRNELFFWSGLSEEVIFRSTSYVMPCIMYNELKLCGKLGILHPGCFIGGKKARSSGVITDRSACAAAGIHGDI